MGLHGAREMSVESISANQTSPDIRTQLPGGTQEVIDLRQIKSILYLGVKGKITVPNGETHRIDTFA
jgi:hypothetical protein